VRLVFVFLLGSSICAVIFAGSIVKGITAAIFTKTLAVSQVRIGDCQISWGKIRYRDIVASGGQIDQVTIPSLTVTFSARSLAALTAQRIECQQAGFSLQSPAVIVSGITCRFEPLQKKGSVAFHQCSFGKVVLSDMQGELYLEQSDLVVRQASVRVFQGIVRFDARLGLARAFFYSVNGNLEGVSLREIERAFELEKRVHLDGSLSGTLFVQGDGHTITGLSGTLASPQPGGAIALYDDTMIRNIAQASQQPIEIIAEGFRDYRYSDGTLLMRTEGGNIIVRLLLEGAAGKRDITITVHGDSPERI